MTTETRAKQACVNCKTRKKKCNRVFPSCSYCILKDLACRYAPVPQQNVITGNVFMYYETPPVQSIHPLMTTPPERNVTKEKTTLYRPVFESLDGIHPEVQRIIQSTGESADNLTALYFRHFHNHLPFVSQTRVQSSLVASGASPGADLSALLLSICLIAYGSSGSGSKEPAVIGRESLYLATKALLAQVQGSLKASLSLVQAVFLLAIYEYANGRPETAFVTMAGCARMAYAARIHIRRHSGDQLENEETGNTWWAIVMYERAIASEVDCLDQPMTTALPSGDTRLPVERDMLDRADTVDPSCIPNIALSCLTSTNIGGFGRAAQAACLLDQVLRGLSVPDVTSRLILLESLDKSIRSFMSFFITHSEKAAVHCASLGMVLRALFLMHNHIFNLPHQTISANFKSLEEWQKNSLAALDTATTMIIDISECHSSLATPSWANGTCPNHIYAVCAALDHMHSRRYARDSPWTESVEDQLRRYLKKVQHQWGWS